MAPARHYLVEVQLQRERVPSFDRYPFSLPVIRNFESIKLHPAVTFFVGENGTGKSTLVEGIAVACGLNAEGGSRNFTFGTHASHSELHQFLRIVRGTRRPRDGFFLRAETFYNVASEIDRLGVEKSYGGKSLHEQSHGESFLSLLTQRFSADGLYILDEPEAALSPARQLAALVRIHELVQGGAQFLIATHSPIVMAYPDAEILRLDGGTIAPVRYTETDHFRTTRDFLIDHRRALAHLLDDTRD